jgi:hypothetical protein
MGGALVLTWAPPAMGPEFYCLCYCGGLPSSRGKIHSSLHLGLALGPCPYRACVYAGESCGG